MFDREATEIIDRPIRLAKGGDGDLGAGEAAGLARVVASFSQSIATTEQEQRPREIEQKLTLLTSR